LWWVTVYGPAKMAQASPKAAAVGEEDGVFCRILLGQRGSLTDKALRDDGSVRDGRAAANDEIFSVDARSDINRVFRAAVDRSVFEPGDALDHAGRTQLDILEDAGVEDARPAPDPAQRRGHRGGVVPDHPFELGNDLGPVAIEGDDVGGVGREFVVDGNLAAAGFVDHVDLRPVAEGAFPFDCEQIDVVDHNVVFDHVVGHVVSDLADVDVIADGAIMDRGVIDARRFGQPAKERHLLSEGPQFDVAIEMRRSDALGVEAFGHSHSRPIGAGAVLLGQLIDLVCR